MSRESNDALRWQAFCYAAGELSDAEAAAFEQRIDADQSLREVLAREVGLIEMVRAAERVESTCDIAVPLAAPSEILAAGDTSSVIGSATVRPASCKGWLEPAGWLSLGTAAGLLIMAAIGWWSGRAATDALLGGQAAETAPVSTATQPALTGQLALLWVEAQCALDDEYSAYVVDDDAAPLGEEEIADLVDASAGHVAPRWLLSAVAHAEGLPLPSASVDGLPGPGEEN